MATHVTKMPLVPPHHLIMKTKWSENQTRINNDSGEVKDSPDNFWGSRIYYQRGIHRNKSSPLRESLYLFGILKLANIKTHAVAREPIVEVKF